MIDFIAACFRPRSLHKQVVPGVNLLRRGAEIKCDSSLVQVGEGHGCGVRAIVVNLSLHIGSQMQMLSRNDGEIDVGERLKYRDHKTAEDETFDEAQADDDFVDESSRYSKTSKTPLYTPRLFVAHPHLAVLPVLVSVLDYACISSLAHCSNFSSAPTRIIICSASRVSSAGYDAGGPAFASFETLRTEDLRHNGGGGMSTRFTGFLRLPFIRRFVGLVREEAVFANHSIGDARAGLLAGVSPRF